MSSAPAPALMHIWAICSDTGRAWQPGNTLSALLAAESFAPEETCRPSVQAMATTLLQGPGRPPAELRAFASRCGATT